MTVKSIKDFGGSERLIDALSSSGVRGLYPPQAEAVRAGLLRDGGSFVIASPTASGKTLIAEMAVLDMLFRRSGKAVYLVPLRALAREKYEDLSGRYSSFGLRVAQSTGDMDSTDPWLSTADLIVCTNEKMDSLVRHHSPWLKDIALVVADEVHMIGDSRRGPTLEVVLTRLRLINPGLRLIALSATIPNALEIAEWLGAKLLESSWRPVPLREGVYFNGAIMFNDGEVKWAQAESRIDIVDLALDTVRDGGQALIFLNTRKATESVGGKVSDFLRPYISEADQEYLLNVSSSVLRSTSEPTRVCKKLAECVKTGAAFHHAGITYSQRRLIEDAFRAGRVKVLASTTTLAMGLNLPSRRVIIRDWWRYEPGLGMSPIPVIEIKQMSGRAGRPGLDAYGEAVILAKNRRDEKYLFEKYIKGTPENTDSRLGEESALRSHILAQIAGMFARDRAELDEFLKSTLFAYQHGAVQLSYIAGEVVDFLEREDMVVAAKGGRLSATRFGRRVAELYIDPLSGVNLRDALRMSEERELSGPFTLLHAIARTPDMMHLSLRKKDYDEMLDIFYAHKDELLLNEEEKYPSEDALSEVKTASVLMQWILETHEDKITGHFGIGPGDLRTMVDLADWLLYSASEVGKVFGLKGPKKGLSLLRARMSYGIKEELLELVALKGIGRVRARNLFDAGFKTLGEIREAKPEELSLVPTIGPAIAEDIIRQASGPHNI